MIQIKTSSSIKVTPLTLILPNYFLKYFLRNQLSEFVQISKKPFNRKHLPEIWLRSVGQLTKLLDFQMFKSNNHLYRLLNLKLVTTVIFLTMKQRSFTRDLKLEFLYFPRYKNLTFQKSFELKNGRFTKKQYSRRSRPKFEMDFHYKNWTMVLVKFIVLVRQSSAYLLIGRARTRTTATYRIER